MGVTNLGKLLRKLRVDHETTLREMAHELDMSSAYLSAIELGKRTVPSDLIYKIRDSYGLSQDVLNELKNSVDTYQSTYTVDLSKFDEKQKDVFLEFARKFNGLGEQDIDEIDSVLKGK